LSFSSRELRVELPSHLQELEDALIYQRRPSEGNGGHVGQKNLEHEGASANRPQRQIELLCGSHSFLGIVLAREKKPWC